jgi:GDSL-like Lipase/Acylhydrolase family
MLSVPRTRHCKRHGGGGGTGLSCSIVLMTAVSMMIGGTGLLWLVYAVATRNSDWISSPYVHTPKTWHTTRPRSTTIIAPPPPNTAQTKSSMPTSIAAAAAAPTTTAASSPKKTLHRILAYGDSLTAGTSGPNLFPYAQYLQSALSMQHRGDNDNTIVVVRHRGLPGWTTQGMLDALDDPQRGLRSAVNAVQDDPPLSLVILLAGTNDLAYGLTAREITAKFAKAACRVFGQWRCCASHAGHWYSTVGLSSGP